MNYLLRIPLHPLAGVFMSLEIIFLAIQIYDIIRYPHERRQWWYFILLILLLMFNLINGLFPNDTSPVSVKLQYILAYGAAYLLGAYFPCYFYRAFELEKLRFHATWGVCLFLFIPYLVFNVLLYLWNGRLVFDREWGVLIPAAYGLVVLTAIFRAITDKHKADSAWPQYREALAVWAAILPWEIMSVFAFYPVSKGWHLLLANLGWLVITFMMMAREIRHRRESDRRYEELVQASLLRLGEKQEHFQAMCAKFLYTPRECDTALLLCEDLTYDEIGEKLHLSHRTIDNNAQRIYRKTGVHTRIGLIRALGLLG